MSLVDGDDYGIVDDAPYQTHLINQPSIVDQLEQAHLTWKGYFQNLPIAGFAGNCYPYTTACLYASKHNGFVNFTHVSSNPDELAKLVPDTNLMDDLGRVSEDNPRSDHALQRLATWAQRGRHHV